MELQACSPYLVSHWDPTNNAANTVSHVTVAKYDGLSWDID